MMADVDDARVEGVSAAAAGSRGGDAYPAADGSRGGGVPCTG